MRSRAPLFLVPFLCSLLVACSEGETQQLSVRPAMVVQPQPMAAQSQSYPGEVRARFEPELAFRIGGKISKRLVEVGDRVREGQPLAELDPQDVRLQLDARRAQLAAAEAALQLARSERDRYKALIDRQMVSRSQYDNAENSFKSAAARLKQAKAEFDVAGNQAAYAVLRAPAAGVISARRAEAGQVVAAGQMVFLLAADGEREVVISLPESVIDRARIGQAVSVELWSHAGQRYPGKIRELSPAADPQSRTYAARVAFSSGEQTIELGQSARVFIEEASQVALSVPLAAVSAEAGEPFVWVIDPASSTAVRTPVKIGPYGQERVPVLEGLKASDWVVLAGVQMLRDGQKVRPVDRDNRDVVLAHKE
jgi:multidrug efflux system membrane fusion protein